MKTRRTEFRIEGKIPRWLLSELRRRYPRALVVQEEPASVARATAWFQEFEVPPGVAFRRYRENRGLTQEEIARRLGPHVTKRHASDMEAGRRGISKATEKRLATIFETSPARFL